jgi:N-acyl-D-amino-acid deacylase
MYMYDIVIKSGYIVDGTGNPWFKGDLGILREEIAAIGNLTGSGKMEIQADGLIVSPGFVDIHSHSDLPILINPNAESSVRQGVTTEVVGNCGLSFAHVDPPYRSAIKDNIYASLPFDNWDWNGVAGYRDRLRKKGVAINIAILAGHCSLRANVMGLERRKPTKAQMSEMKHLLHRALAEGALGFSTGLTYLPAVYANIKELVELCQVVQQHGKLFAVHMRGQGAGLIDSVAETIEIGQRSGVSVQISHFGAFGPDHWGKITPIMEMIDKAHNQGINIAYDVVPTLEGLCTLTSTLPPWVIAGGRERMLERLRDPELRGKCKLDWEQGYPEWQGFVKPMWERWTITEIVSVKNRGFAGKTVAEIARLRRESSCDAAINLILEEEGHVGVAPLNKSQEEVDLMLTHPLGMISSDAFVTAPYGPLGKTHPHWRSYGLFPSVLRSHVRERAVLSWEDGIRRMTSLPAQRIGLRDRGILFVGAAADVVVFDPEQVREKATFASPHQYPEGIEWVIVNGEVVVQDGEHTGARPGKAL